MREYLLFPFDSWGAGHIIRWKWKLMSRPGSWYTEFFELRECPSVSWGDRKEITGESCHVWPDNRQETVAWGVITSHFLLISWWGEYLTLSAITAWEAQKPQQIVKYLIEMWIQLLCVCTYRHYLEFSTVVQWPWGSGYLSCPGLSAALWAVTHRQGREVFSITISFTALLLYSDRWAGRSCATI